MADAETRWECENGQCKKLLGTCRDGIICVRIKSHQYNMEGGRVTTACPRCNRLNSKESGKGFNTEHQN